MTKKCLCGKSIKQKPGTTTGGKKIKYYPPKCETCLAKMSEGNKKFLNLFAESFWIKN